jgi:hypothetical protein
VSLVMDRIEIPATPEQVATAKRIDPDGLLASANNGRDLILAVLSEDNVIVHTIMRDGSSIRQTATVSRAGWQGLGPNPCTDPTPWGSSRHGLALG